MNTTFKPYEFFMSVLGIIVIAFAINYQNYLLAFVGCLLIGMRINI